MSIVINEQCHAMTGRRWAKEPRRCKHTTNRGIFCWQHLKQKEGFRIKKSTIPNAGLGLFTTKPIKNNVNVTEYSGDHVVSRDPNYGGPYVLETKKYHYIDASKTNEKGLGRWINHQPLRKSNTKFVINRGKAYMKSTKPIAKDKELFVPYGAQYFRYFPLKKVRKAPRKSALSRLR